MSYKRPFKHISRANKLFVLLIMLSLLGGVAPTAAMNLDEGAAGACDSLRALAVNDTLAQSASWRSTEGEWIKFTVQPNARYRLQVSNASGLNLALYDRCDAKGTSVELRDGELEFTAMRGGDYYLLVRHDGISAAGLSGYQAALAPAAPHRPRLTAVQNVPEAVQRRAVEFLEELRGGGLAPEWADARVNPNARILYRPDIQEPAYYEFTVEKPVDSRYEPAGFIQLAAGEHDYVLTQWDVSGMSPTQELEELAPLGVQPTEFYKLDALSYAAEYEEVTAIGIAALSDNVINLGDLPGRITGLEGIPEEPADLVTEGIDSEGNVTREGPTELPLTEQSDWDSWAALKAGYEQEYGPLLKSLKQRAGEGWELEKNLGQYGESLIKGDVRTVYELPAQTISSIEVSGDGAAAQYLKQEELRENGTLKGIRLTVLDEPADLQTRLPFEVGLQYANGVSETVKYAIVNAEALPIHDVYLPLVVGGGSSPAGAAADEGVRPADWGPWHYYWADGDAGSIRYGQISAGTSPNTSGCASGCGGTAWAMLFAWVDRRAAENHWRWENHWGLYRVNGSVAGANAVAPLNQDAGVRNMTWEIRNHIDTWCIFGSGATWPWNMINASRYMRPRATASWRMQTKYDPTGLCWFGACDRNRNLARDQIIDYRAPAVVGTGWLKHYPMAYGYAWRSKRSCFLWSCSTTYSRWFYVNNGWSGNNNGWTEADDIWFAGVYRPG